MINDERQEISKAKTIAFRFLKVRERSVVELRQKLMLKKISEKAIDQTIDFLLAKKFLDDRAFARNWIRYRQGRPFGQRRIQLELRQKGVDEGIITEELSSAFDGIDQIGMLTDMAARRASRYQDDDPVKRKRKVFDFLARRGFNLDAIKRAIKNI